MFGKKRIEKVYTAPEDSREAYLATRESEADASDLVGRAALRYEDTAKGWMELEKRDNALSDLEVAKNLYKIILDTEGLERVERVINTIKRGKTSLVRRVVPGILAIGGFIGTLIFFLPNITGNVVSNSFGDLNLVGVLFFLVGILGTWSWIRIK